MNQDDAPISGNMQLGMQAIPSAFSLLCLSTDYAEHRDCLWCREAPEMERCAGSLFDRSWIRRRTRRDNAKEGGVEIMTSVFIVFFPVSIVIVICVRRSGVLSSFGWLQAGFFVGSGNATATRLLCHSPFDAAVM